MNTMSLYIVSQGAPDENMAFYRYYTTVEEAEETLTILNNLDFYKLCKNKIFKVTITDYCIEEVK